MKKRLLAVLIIIAMIGIGGIASARILNPDDTGSIPAALISGILSLLHGGTGSDLSHTGGPGQVLKQSTAGGHVTVGQLNYSDLLGTPPSGGGGGSGTYVLPAASVLSLGGIFAMAAATTHQFMTYIDESGIQHTTQPFFTDLGGTIAPGQLGTSYTDGQLLIGNSSTGILTPASLTAGSNITITNTPGHITIAASGGGGGGGSSPGGSNNDVQINASGSLGPLLQYSLAAYKAHNTVANGLAFDPRDPAYGAVCGGYNLFTANGTTKTFAYTIPFAGSSSTDSTSFMVFYEPSTGFGTATMLTSADYTVTGVNSGVGGNITFTVAPPSGNTIFVVHDDAPGFVAASSAAVLTGGHVDVPDGCTIYGTQSTGMVLAEGTNLIGQGFTQNYGFQGQGTKPILRVIAPTGIAPAYGINITGKAQQFFEGFEITANVPGFNQAGFLTVPVLIGAGSSGAGFGQVPGIVLQYLTLNYGIVGFGAPIGGNSAYIFATIRFNNFTSNTAGIYGPLSDQQIIANNFSSNGGFGTLGNAGGYVVGPQQGAAGCSGAARVEYNRFEFNQQGIVVKNGCIISMEGNQFDGNSYCGIDLNTAWQAINITGGWFRGNGNLGTGSTTSHVAGHDAHICFNGGTGSGSLQVSNVNFYTNYSEGAPSPSPAYVLDWTTTGSMNDNVSFTGGHMAFVAGNLGSSSTDTMIFRNGRPANLKFLNVDGQANAGNVLNGKFLGQGRGLPSNSWSSYYYVGDAQSAGSQSMSASLAYPYLLGAQLNVGPTPYLLDNFSSFECDVVHQAVFPNINPNETHNPLITWLPSPSDPTYGGGLIIPTHQAAADSCRRAGLTWMTIPRQYKVYGQNTACVKTGSWTNDSSYGGTYGVTSNTSGDNLTCTIDTTGGPIYEWYQFRGANGGTFTWQLDSTTTGTASTNSGGNDFTFPISSASRGVGVIRIPASSSGSHTISNTLTSTTSTSNTVTILGIGTVPPTTYNDGNPTVFMAGQTYEGGDTNSANTAIYNQDEKNDVFTLQGDGLSVNFVDVRNPICCNTTTDMQGGINVTKLTALGQKHVADVFGAAIQYQKSPGGIIDPKDYGAACNTEMFTGQYISGVPSHLVSTTTGSPLISISNYVFQPGPATQTGGGDVGKVISIYSGNGDVGPTTYIAAVTTATNKATLGSNMLVTTNIGQAVMGGYPTNPGDPSTARDDTIPIQLATAAANSILNPVSSLSTGGGTGGGRVYLPNNCLVHNLIPANNVEIVGNMGGLPYVTPNNPGRVTTTLYVGATGFASDPTYYGINLSGTRNVKLKDFLIKSVAFPYLGAQLPLACIGMTAPAGLLDTEAVLLDHVGIFNCPVGFGQPFSLGQRINFTASISGTTMTVASIDSTNLATAYNSPDPGSNVGYNMIGSDWLALGRTVSGPGVTTGTTITAIPKGGFTDGGVGTYTVSISQTTTSASMTSPPASNVIAGSSRFSWMGQNGIGYNGDFSDFASTNDTFTGNFSYGWYMGPVNSGSGNGGTRILGGRWEENGHGFVCDGCYGIQFTGTQLQFDLGYTLVLKNGWKDVQFTGGAIYGGGRCNTAPDNKSAININGSGTHLTLSGTQLLPPDFGSGCSGSTTYLFQTATGTTTDYITIEGGDGNSAGFGSVYSNLYNFKNKTPTHYRQDVGGWPKLDSYIIPTVSGLSAVTTSKTGGVYSGGILAGTTTGAGTLSLTGLPVAPNGWNCDGGDLTTPSRFNLSATTSSSCALSVTATVNSGDQLWYSGYPR